MVFVLNYRCCLLLIAFSIDRILSIHKSPSCWITTTLPTRAVNWLSPLSIVSFGTTATLEWGRRMLSYTEIAIKTALSFSSHCSNETIWSSIIPGRKHTAFLSNLWALLKFKTLASRTTLWVPPMWSCLGASYGRRRTSSPTAAVVCANFLPSSRLFNNSTPLGPSVWRPRSVPALAT